MPLAFPPTSICSETVPGTFEVVSQEPYVSSCFGFCSGGSQDPCDPFGPPTCPAGESCVDLGLAAICLLPAGDECSTAADCMAPYTSCEFVDPTTSLTAGACVSDQLCNTSADCPPGYSCADRPSPDPDICVSDTACSGPGLCDSGNYPPTTEFLIENVGAAGSSTLATCDGLPTQYNSNDAQACITSIETALGAPCVTLP